MAIAIHTPADSGSTPDRPIAIVPVARLRHALSTIRKVMPARRKRNAPPHYATVQAGDIIAGDPFTGMVELPLDRNPVDDDAYVIPLDALVAAAKGAKGSIAIYADRIMRADGTSIAYTVKPEHADAIMDDAVRMVNMRPPFAFRMYGSELCDLANIVGSHASTDDTRPVLTGIYFSPVAEDGTVDLVATDSYRLAITSVQTYARSSDTHMLLPARMIAAVAHGIGKFGFVTVEFAHDDHDSGVAWIRAIADDPEGDPGDTYTVLQARVPTMDGQYPNYRALIPDGILRHVTLADDACDSIITFARMRRTNTPMRITVEDSTLAVEWEGAELTVPCHVEGEQDPITFALNAAFAADCLAAMPQGGATIGIINPLRPFTFTAADPSQDYYSVTSVVMPMRI